MIELQKLSFEVEEDGVTKDIIKDLDLTIKSGIFTVITGPNGGGKSTLAKLIAGIRKPTSGRIIFDGTDITDMSITDRAKLGIGFAFQSPVKFKGIRVIDLLRIAAGKDLKVNDACSYLAEVGLCARDYINREVNGSLSGGELKMIEIATVIARGSKAAIFDEPEAGIDIWSFQNLTKIFERMRSDRNAESVVVISHQERILRIADEIIVLADGKVAKQGRGEDILPEIMGTSSAVDVCSKLS